jgi:phytoene synthase
MLQTHWEHRLNILAGKLTPSKHPVFSYWAGDASLEKAYALCGRITSQHSKSTYKASACLPEEKRAAVRALFAFCYTVKNVVKANSDQDKESALDYWRSLAQGATHPHSDDLVGQAWVDTCNRYLIPTRYAAQFIEAVSRDQESVRYESFDELTTHCYGVASTIGLMVLHILGFKSAEAASFAIKLSVAMQMTNILRETGKDFHHGQIQLPQDELREYGVNLTNMETGGVDDHWREFMKFQISRVRQLLAEKNEGMKYFGRDERRFIAAACEACQTILKEIEKLDYAVFAKPATISIWEKLAFLPGTWLKPMGS